MENLELARGALVDIAFSKDVTVKLTRSKAKRIYETIIKEAEYEEN